jgi:hypothetical protein
MRWSEMAMASKGGCWCLYCGWYGPAAQMGYHLWLQHGIIHSPRRQGYRQANGQPPTPLVPEAAAMAASQDVPAQPVLFGAEG